MRLQTILLATAATLLGACTDRTPTAPRAVAEAPETPVPVRFDCLARVRERTLRCGAASAVPAGVRAAVIGGQGSNLRITSSSPVVDAATGTFSFDVAVQNLLPQAIGTADGVTPDARGVRLFFHTGPTVTSGWGTVSVMNADGVGIFTAANQPYFQYGGMLRPGESAPARPWRLHFDPDVDHFGFTIFAYARQQPLLVIDEIMAHPTTASESAGEWIEVYNPGIDPVNLQGWQIVSGGDAVHTVSESLVLNQRSYLVLGGSTSDSANGGAQVRYAWKGIDLANGTPDYVVLRSPAGLTVDSVDWGAAPGETAAPPTAGVSRQLTSLTAEHTRLSGASSAWIDALWQFGTGQLGNPGRKSLLPLAGASIAMGNGHACLVDRAGQAWCWGTNTSSNLGIDSYVYYSEYAVPVAQPAGVAFTDLFATSGSSCALSTTGQAYCWGGGAPTGHGLARRGYPVPAPQGGVSFTALAGTAVDYGNSQCGLDPAGVAWCWGQDAPVPGTVTAVAQPAGVKFTRITVGGGALCGLTSAGVAYCRGPEPALGIGHIVTVSTDTFTAVRQPVGVTFAAISTNGSNTCAVSTIGQAFCWGYNSYGQVGNGTFTTSLEPVAVLHPASVRFTAITLGRSHTCALATDGRVFCWGYNLYGQLGDGTRELRRTPTAVVGPVRFSVISAGGDNTCGLQQGTGQPYCWGNNQYSQLGTTYSHSPQPVLIGR